MNIESFNTTCGHLPATVRIDIDENAEIVGVYLKGTTLELEISDNEMQALEENTYETRMAILRECQDEIREYEDHIKFESAQWRYV